MWKIKDKLLCFSSNKKYLYSAYVVLGDLNVNELKQKTELQHQFYSMVQIFPKSEHFMVKVSMQSTHPKDNGECVIKPQAYIGIRGSSCHVPINMMEGKE